MADKIKKETSSPNQEDVVSKVAESDTPNTSTDTAPNANAPINSTPTDYAKKLADNSEATKAAADKSITNPAVADSFTKLAERALQKRQERESAQQAKSDKQAKVLKGLAAVSDLGGAIASLYGTTRGALPIERTSATSGVNDKYEKVLKDRMVQAQKDRDALIAGQQADLAQQLRIEAENRGYAFQKGQADAQRKSQADLAKQSQDFTAEENRRNREANAAAADKNAAAAKEDGERRDATQRYIANLNASTSRAKDESQEKIAKQKSATLNNSDPNSNTTWYDVGTDFAVIPKSQDGAFTSAVMNMLGAQTSVLPQGGYDMTTNDGTELSSITPHDALAYINSKGTAAQKTELAKIVSKYKDSSSQTSSKPQSSPFDFSNF